MINNELIEKLLSLLQSKQYGAVKTLVHDMNEVDVAEAIEEIFEENEELETLLRLVPPASQGDGGGNVCVYAQRRAAEAC